MTHPFSLPTRRFALAAATLAAACASDADPVQNAPTLVDAGTGDGRGVAPPPGCDPTADPKDAPACVVDPTPAPNRLQRQRPDVGYSSSQGSPTE